MISKSALYRLKNCINFSIFPLLLLLIFNPNIIKAEIISYPAQLEGCSYNSGNYYYSRPTCGASAYFILENSWSPYTLTAVSCPPEIITAPQPLSCTFFLLSPEGTPSSVVINYNQGLPNYTCPYGGRAELNSPPGVYLFNGITWVGSVPFACEINTDTPNIILTKNLGSDSACSSIGNPVHPRTGNKSTTESDYTSISLIFTRYYNSHQNKLDRNIGILWRHNYSTRLVLNPTAIPPITFAERPDGKTIFFRFIGGQWISDGDISDKLIEVPGSGWQLISTDDTIETYNTSGKLISITDRNDRTQTLSYDTNGRLSALLLTTPAAPWASPTMVPAASKR